MAIAVWTPAERQFIKDNCHRLKDDAIAAALTRISGRVVSVHAVRRVRHRLGIRKRRGRGLCEVLPSFGRDDTPASLGFCPESPTSSQS